MAGWMTEHWHARKICPPGPCVKCGAVKAEVHHKNDDWKDRRPENLERLCRSCHIKEHRPRKLCMICGTPQKGRGLCNKHLLRLKRWGNPMLVKVNQHMPVTLSGD